MESEKRTDVAITGKNDEEMLTYLDVRQLLDREPHQVSVNTPDNSLVRHDQQIVTPVHFRQDFTQAPSKRVGVKAATNVRLLFLDI